MAGTRPTFDDQSVVEHFDRDMHVAHSVRTMNDGVYDGLKPGVVRVFRSGIKVAVRSELGELANLWLKNLNCTLNNGREISLSPIIFDRVVVRPRHLLLPFEPSKSNAASGELPGWVFGKQQHASNIGHEASSLDFPEMPECQYLLIAFLVR